MKVRAGLLCALVTAAIVGGAGPAAAGECTSFPSPQNPDIEVCTYETPEGGGGHSVSIRRIVVMEQYFQCCDPEVGAGVIVSGPGGSVVGVSTAVIVMNPGDDLVCVTLTAPLSEPINECFLE